jgi:hypothetical protein
MVYIRKSYKILIGKSEWGRPFVRHKQGGRKKIHVYLKNHWKNFSSLIE